MAEPAQLALVAGAVVTASGAGAAFDAERPGRSVTVALTTSATSGTAPSLVVIVEHSETGLGPWLELGRFPAITGNTAVSLSAGPALRYLRARWEISGTAASFTLVAAARAYSHLITRQQLRDHIGSVFDMAFDDGNVGVASSSAVDGILAYASSMLRGKIGPVDDLGGLTPETQSELVRVGLDIGLARACIRSPEVFRLPGQQMLDAARKDLKEIRVGTADVAPKPDGKPERPLVESYGSGAVSLPRRW